MSVLMLVCPLSVVCSEFAIVCLIDIVYSLHIVSKTCILAQFSRILNKVIYDLKIVVWQNAHNYAALTIFVPSARTIWFGWSGMRYGMVLSFSPLHHSRSNFKTQQAILKYTTSADPTVYHQCWCENLQLTIFGFWVLGLLSTESSDLIQRRKSKKKK